MRVEKPQPRFVLCIRSEGPDDLEPRGTAWDGNVRVIDESGEDYLYPAEYFVLVRLPVGIAREALWPPKEELRPAAQRLRRG